MCRPERGFIRVLSGPGFGLEIAIVSLNLPGREKGDGWASKAPSPQSNVPSLKSVYHPRFSVANFLGLIYSQRK
jgi:hypothetical protein